MLNQLQSILTLLLFGKWLHQILCRSSICSYLVIWENNNNEVKINSKYKPRESYTIIHVTMMILTTYPSLIIIIIPYAHVQQWIPTLCLFVSGHKMSTMSKVGWHTNSTNYAFVRNGKLLSISQVRLSFKEQRKETFLKATFRQETFPKMCTYRDSLSISRRSKLRLGLKIKRAH